MERKRDIEVIFLSLVFMINGLIESSSSLYAMWAHYTYQKSFAFSTYPLPFSSFMLLNGLDTLLSFAEMFGGVFLLRSAPGAKKILIIVAALQILGVFWVPLFYLFIPGTSNAVLAYLTRVLFTLSSNRFAVLFYIIAVYYLSRPKLEETQK